MPPQQPDRLLDLVDDGLDFRAHWLDSGSIWRRNLIVARDGDKVAMVNERLLGTWRLISAVREEIPSGAKIELFGPNPVGYLNYAPDGRMLALIVRGGRVRPAGTNATPGEAEALYRSMLSYGGTYAVDGNEVTHRVDIAWNQSWTGSTQTRTFAFEGERLHLTTPPSPDPTEGRMSVRRMVWERIA